MRNYLVVGFAVAMIAGCGNKDVPKVGVPTPLVAAQEPQALVPVPPMPPPNAVDDGIERPKPGQNNDHSSPEFKAGSSPDLKKDQLNQ